jgi:membrane protein DedA with SNARE-associated domain
MEQFLLTYGYLALALGTYLEGETAILVASSLAGSGLFKIPYVIFFGFLGSFVSDWVYFLIGKLNGKIFLAKRPALRQKFEPVQNFFKTNRLQILFSYRFLYGFRIIIPITLGMSELKLVQFLGYSIMAGLIWATTVSTVGYFVGRFLELNPKSFEENILYIMLGFATFGLTIGYLVKTVAIKKINKTHPQ